MDYEWGVQVDGHPADLEWVAGSAIDGVTIEHQDDGTWLLKSGSFDDLADASGVREAGASLINIVNGVGAVFDSGFRPLTVSHVYQLGSDGSKAAFVLLQSAIEIRARVHAVLTVGDDAPEPVQPSCLDMGLRAGQSDRYLSEALRIFGQIPYTIDRLYKIFELSQQHSDHSSWTSKRQKRRFTHSANSPAASGEQARHAVERKDPPGDPMALSEASGFIRSILDRWIRAVWTSLQ